MKRSSNLQNLISAALSSEHLRYKNVHHKSLTKEQTGGVWSKATSRIRCVTTRALAPVAENCKPIYNTFSQKNKQKVAHTKTQAYTRENAQKIAFNIFCAFF